MRMVLTVFLFFISQAAALAETVFPALEKTGKTAVLTVYSSLDELVSKPLVGRFQAKNPSIEIRYHDLQSLEIYDRVIEETDQGAKTADIVISSAMDLQVKLVNDGYARAIASVGDRWPDWAKWRNSAFGLTFEPSVIVYHKPSFAQGQPPANRAELVRLLRENDDSFFGKAATYDIERSGLGFLFLARDTEHDRDIWQLISAMGAAGVKLYSNSSSILERVADGRLALGYNILGSYAENWAVRHSDLGIILPEDFTVVMSRIALVPQNSQQAQLGTDFLKFLMSEEGQNIMASNVRLPALHPGVKGVNTASAMMEKYGPRLRPISIGPGLVAYLDQAKRARFLKQWNQALRGE